MDDPDLEERPRITRKKVIRLLVALVIAIGATSAWVYVRYLAPKAGLGGPCRYAMNCTSAAPRCMRESEDGEGVCSRPCEVDAGDCASGVHCVAIELDDERDERGVPLKGGYCFPQAFIDAKKKRPRDAGAPIDSWIDVPGAAGQLEGEIVLRWERAGAAAAPEPKSFVVKGSLLRAPGSGKSRTIVDTSSLRVFAVDDDKRAFAPSALDPAPGEGKIVKTGEKDRVEGRECDVWRIEDGRSKREACVLMGGALVDPSVRAVPVWMHELAVRGAFPLRVVEQDASGKEVSRMVATRVDLKAVDASVFAIPRSYKNLAAR